MSTSAAKFATFLSPLDLYDGLQKSKSDFDKMLFLVYKILLPIQYHGWMIYQYNSSLLFSFHV